MYFLQCWWAYTFIKIQCFFGREVDITWVHMFGKAKAQLWVSLHKGNTLLKITTAATTTIKKKQGLPLSWSWLRRIAWLASNHQGSASFCLPWLKFQAITHCVSSGDWTQFPHLAIWALSPTPKSKLIFALQRVSPQPFSVNSLPPSLHFLH